jgi:hypothetical protein
VEKSTIKEVKEKPEEVVFLIESPYVSVVVAFIRTKEFEKCRQTIQKALK